MNELKIASLSVRGLRQENKRKEMFTKFRKLDLDIICLQETHVTQTEHELIQKQWAGKCFFSKGEANSWGTAILIKSQNTLEIEQMYKDRVGRVVILKITYDQREFILANIYAPNGDDPDFFRELFHTIISFQIPDIMIIGDFNIALNPALDHLDQKQYTPKAVNIVGEFSEALDLVDVWRTRNENKKQMSWYRRKAFSTKLSGSRIDFALTSISLTNVVENIQYSYGHKTDHALLMLELGTRNKTRGLGYWKFNKNLLHDKVFVNTANKIIDSAEGKFRPATDEKVWECCKDGLTRWAKKKSQLNAKKRKEKLELLQKKLVESKDKLETENNINTIAEIKTYEAEIQYYLEEETRKAAFRSKVKYVKDYERSSKFFFSLEKAKYNSK